MVTGLTLPEIAERYGRPEDTIRHWRRAYAWPQPAGKRGRWLEYDPGEVDAAVRAILTLGDDHADPDELLDARAAAREARISWATLRADISRGRWPQPDNDAHGVKRWKRSTVRAAMAARRPNRRRQQAGPAE